MLVKLADEIGDSKVFQCEAEAIRQHGFSDNPLFHSLIATSIGEPCGLALFFPMFSTTRGQPGVYVQDLWVAKIARGQGLGERLLSKVAHHATSSWQATYLGLTVYGDNPKATKFYHRLGFHGDERDKPIALNDQAFQRLKDQTP